VLAPEVASAAESDLEADDLELVLWVVDGVGKIAGG